MNQEENVHIATITKLVLLEKSQLGSQDVNKEKLLEAKPKLVQKSKNVYSISLWGNECGNLDTITSAAIAQISILESIVIKM